MDKFKFDPILDLWTIAFQGVRKGNTIHINKIGKGKIEAFEISENIEIIKFNFTLNQDLDLTRKKIPNALDYVPVFFGEPVAGNVINEVKEEDDKTIETEFLFKSLGAVCTNTLEEISWTYPKDKEMKFISVRLKIDYLNTLIDRSDRLKQVFNFDDSFFIFEEFDPLMNLMFKRIFEVEEDDMFSKDYIELYARNLLLTFLKNIAKREEITESNKYPFNVEPVFKARQVLRSEISKPVNIDELTRECGLSESRLRFLFKKVFGTTIHQYHQDIRLNHSREFLQLGKMTMSMIAIELGFSSASHFSMVFKKKYNISPKEYKQDQSLWFK